MASDAEWEEMRADLSSAVTIYFHCDTIQAAADKFDEARKFDARFDNCNIVAKKKFARNEGPYLVEIWDSRYRLGES